MRAAQLRPLPAETDPNSPVVSERLEMLQDFACQQQYFMIDSLVNKNGMTSLWGRELVENSRLNVIFAAHAVTRWGRRSENSENPGFALVPSLIRGYTRLAKSIPSSETQVMLESQMLIPRCDSIRDQDYKAMLARQVWSHDGKPAPEGTIERYAFLVATRAIVLEKPTNLQLVEIAKKAA